MKLSRREETLVYAGAAAMRELSKIKYDKMHSDDLANIDKSIETIALVILYSNVKYKDMDTIRKLSMTDAFENEFVTVKPGEKNVLTKASVLTRLMMSSYSFVLDTIVSKLDQNRFNSDDCEKIRCAGTTLYKSLLVSKAGYLDSDLAYDMDEITEIYKDNLKRMRKNINILCVLKLGKRHLIKVLNRLK